MESGEKMRRGKRRRTKIINLIMCNRNLDSGFFFTKSYVVILRISVDLKNHPIMSYHTQSSGFQANDVFKYHRLGSNWNSSKTGPDQRKT